MEGKSFLQLEGIAGDQFRLSLEGVEALNPGANPRMVYLTTEAPAHGQEGRVTMQGKLPPFAVITMLASEQFLSEKVQ